VARSSTSCSATPRWSWSAWPSSSCATARIGWTSVQPDVTQEFLAEMIGTQRPSISLAVSQFKDEGLISYSRGRITITDRECLLERSCACIGIMHEEERRLRETLEKFHIGKRRA
jgi:hypothetical protein